MSQLSKGLKKVERAIGGMIPHTSAADRRTQMQATREQMDYYKEQKDTLQKANEDLQNQKDYESKRLHEKQIRALRGSYKRSRGFLGSDTATDETTPNETLG